MLAELFQVTAVDCWLTDLNFYVSWSFTVFVATGLLLLAPVVYLIAPILARLSTLSEEEAAVKEISIKHLVVKVICLYLTIFCMSYLFCLISSHIMVVSNVRVL